MDAGADAGSPDAGVDAGPADAGAPDAGAPHAAAPAVPVAPSPVDAGAAHAEGPTEEAAPKANLADDPESALKKSVRRCFRDAEKIHWGPQSVVLKATVSEQDGAGVLTEGKVVEDSIRDVQSHDCFIQAMEKARFKLATGDAGQEKTFRFQHVPKAH